MFSIAASLRVYLRARIKKSEGQDLIEYALMAGFVAVAAGALMPNVAFYINQIFSHVLLYLNLAVGGSVDCGALPENAC